MSKNTIDEKINRIKADARTVLNENCDDFDSIDFIKHKATLLKARIHALKGKIGLELDEDKKIKMAYQKLYNSLQDVQASIMFKIPLNPTAEDIKHQIELIKAVQKDIENL